MFNVVSEAVDRINENDNPSWIIFEKDGVTVEFILNDEGNWINVLTDPDDLDNQEAYVRAVYDNLNDVINFIELINTDGLIKNFDMY